MVLLGPWGVYVYKPNQKDQDGVRNLIYSFLFKICLTTFVIKKMGQNGFEKQDDKS